MRASGCHVSTHTRVTCAQGSCRRASRHTVALHEQLQLACVTVCVLPWCVHSRIASLWLRCNTRRSNPHITIVDATSQLVVPGFVDLHVHLTGGGGEMGPQSRTPRASCVHAGGWEMHVATVS